jgi:hypothetical protein
VAPFTSPMFEARECGHPKEKFENRLLGPTNSRYLPAPAGFRTAVFRSSAAIIR